MLFSFTKEYFDLESWHVWFAWHPIIFRDEEASSSERDVTRIVFFQKVFRCKCLGGGYAYKLNSFENQTKIFKLLKDRNSNQWYEIPVSNSWF